ncbi:transposase [Williamwhitmania taraxaci]|uniref:Putative transposase n=1 Tax=Williamwhitmania taraxaci TaxID=1640674 RepID=A0A1G6J4Q8_9BACT|nr:transposase [Williamwhitmania taraxaci]SDC12936.1 putative transposase [Williamwhitmania taraxaci]
MEFEVGHLYHIYNQGNNRQRVFFTRENYLFFLEKISKHITPYADVLAWCLMPNHFHLMVHVNHISLPENASPSATSMRTSISRARTANVTLQQSIGIMLASYTRAINKQNGWSGSLFRQETKAICLTRNDELTRAWFFFDGVTSINNTPPELQYPNLCYNYILRNPVKDGLVKSIDEWEFSSYLDVVGERHGRLISRERIAEFGLTI